nr:methyl-accepting chemotaxis protein [uncultured Carboxylicivirga sp.]
MSIFTLGVLLIVLAGGLCWLIVYWVFRRSFVLLIGSIFLAVIDAIACFAFVVGSQGLVHLVWAVPISIVLIVSSYFVLSKKVKDPIQHLTTILQNMSQKNLKDDVNQKYVKEGYEIGDIAVAVIKLMESNRMMVKLMDDSSSLLVGSSSNITSSSSSISSGASEQASGIEEISTAIEEMTANIATNADNAKKSQKISDEAQKRLEESFQKVKVNVELMKRIDEQTAFVRQIAEQTNILALNASIEAVKAGEAGKGFSVVAKEVRTLAEQANVASNRIVAMAKEGVVRVNEIMEEITFLVNKTNQSAHLVQEVAAASEEMNIGANQINSAIQELNGVVQENAASAEELSASSNQLLDEAKGLKGIVSTYQYKAMAN